jgi:glycosyltransferase involved in cell wall biosynthesis
MKILVLSTYDITPVRDGGQTRYVNIYRQVAQHHEVTVLAYDFRRRTDRVYFIGEHLKVVASRCGEADRDRFSTLVERTQRHMHDILCVREYRFSPEFYAALAREAARAQVVVASHPYLAPLAFGFCPDSAVKIYEAHNVEFDAKTSYFADDPDPLLRRLLDDTWQAERLACVEADYVTAVSDGDADRLAELYRISRRKITTSPNGVDTSRYPLLHPDEKEALRSRFAAGDRPLAVFIGSGHAPNVDAYLRTRAMLAQAGYSGLVILIGSIGECVPPAALPFEEVMLGFTDEALKTALVCAADFALQLSFTGAGTTLKLFEYMASRSLIIANAFGRRGIPHDGWCWPVETAGELRRFLAQAPWQREDGRQIAERARQLAEEHYDWRRIAASYGQLIATGRSAVAPLELT